MTPSAPGRRRVLWLTKGLGLGGAEILLSSSARLLDADRFEVEVGYVLQHKDALASSLRDDGIAVHPLGDGTRGGWIRRLRQLLRQRRYALVHTHAPAPAALVRVAPWTAGVPLVHTEHNVWSRYRWPTYAANAITYGRNAMVIAVSSAVAQSIVAPWWAPWASNPPVEVLHHGIDATTARDGPAARAAARRLLGLGESDRVVGTVANLTPKKDQATLLRGFAALSADRPDARLVVVGDGPLRQPLEQRAAALGIADRTTFAGSRSDVMALLPAFDVFTLSSLHEGLSIALIEAMASGLPSVVTRVGGLPEVVTHGREAYLVPAGDPAALGERLGELLDDPVLRRSMGDEAVRSSRRFGLDRAVDRIQQIYDQVLSA